MFCSDVVPNTPLIRDTFFARYIMVDNVALPSTFDSALQKSLIYAW